MHVDPRRRRALIFIGPFLLLGADARDARAQIPVERETCTACRIRLDPLVAIGTHAGEHAPTWTSEIVADAQGRYFVTNTHTPGALSVFDASGNLLKVIGREGAGPGEGRFFIGLGTKADTVIALDGSLGRYVFIDPRTLRHARYERARVGGRRFLVDSAGSIIAAPPSSRTGAPIEVMDTAGAVTSFGNPLRVPRHLSWVEERHLTFMGDRLVAAVANRFTVEVYNTQRELVSEFVRVADWAKAYDDLTGTASRLVDIAVQPGSSRALILATVPDPHWREEAPAVEREGRYSSEQMDRKLDTVIEYWDLRSGELLVSSRFDRALDRFVGWNRIIKGITREDGGHAFHVWTLRVEGLPR